MAPPSPPSSPSRPAFINLTNEEHNLLTTPGRKRPSEGYWTRGDQKRVKLQDKEVVVHEVSDDDDDDDSDDESPQPYAQTSQRPYNVYGIRNATMRAGPSSLSRLPPVPTRSILGSFVSSNGSDVFNVHPIDEEGASVRSPPYACAYSQASKRGAGALLAVSTEQGGVHILNTAKRNDWDSEPPRTAFMAHHNGIFDVQWSPLDDRIATACADKTVCVWDMRPSGPVQLHELQQHTSTIKCVAWDSSRGGNVLCSGGRDGLICVWDLRLASSNNDDGLKPVLAIPKAHETEKPRRSKKKLAAPPARGVVSVLFSDADPCSLISVGSYDGILRQWDLRYMDKKRSATAHTTKNLSSPVHMSSADPTTYDDTRRPRGISSLSAGSGPTAGLLFALAHDSRIHTYDLRSLEPLSGRTDDPNTDMWSYGHKDMKANSFYVRASVSPCGQWIACGGTDNGRAFAFDISDAGKMKRSSSDDRGRGVELWGQRGGVGAVDWADGTLATCADDGSVRIWRSDLETYRRCEDDPEAMKYPWCWALGT